jgi:hypothetical protein
MCRPGALVLLALVCQSMEPVGEFDQRPARQMAASGPWPVPQGSKKPQATCVPPRSASRPLYAWHFVRQAHTLPIGWPPRIWGQLLPGRPFGCWGDITNTFPFATERTGGGRRFRGAAMAAARRLPRLATRKSVDFRLDGGPNLAPRQTAFAQP